MTYYNINIIDENGKGKYEWQITYSKDECTTEQIIEWGHTDNIDDALSEAAHAYRKYQHSDKNRYPVPHYGYCEDCDKQINIYEPKMTDTDKDLANDYECTEKFYVCPDCLATYVDREIKHPKRDECYIYWERKFWG